MGQDETRVTVRLQPATMLRIQRWQGTEGSRSRNEFIEKAIEFYTNYLTLHDDSAVLPTAVTSAMDGRLKLLEKSLTSLLFKLAVEQDMVNGILADVYQFSEEELRHRRGESVQNVKRTNGRLSLEQRVRSAALPVEEDSWLD